MAKKLQIFVSSTYQDLIAERQAAVEAILTAGHIPAGMELFTAGDESQLETIYRWIDESDIFMLILGGRYGSIEKVSGKSYTQLEYEHSLNCGKATFSVVMHDDALAAKVKRDGPNVLELENRDKFAAFKSTVLSKMCMFFHDHKDIQLAFHRTLARLLRERDFSGWVSGAEISNTESMGAEIARLSKENSELRSKLLQAEEKSGAALKFGGLTYEQLRKILANTSVELPESIDKSRRKVDLLHLFYNIRNSLPVGVSNKYGVSAEEAFVFYVAAQLIPFGLTETIKVAGVQWQRIRTTKSGNDFLARLTYEHSVSNEAFDNGQQDLGKHAAAKGSVNTQAVAAQNAAPGKTTRARQGKKPSRRSS